MSRSGRDSNLSGSVLRGPRRAAPGWLLAGCTFLVALHQIGTFDYWTHLALGRALWSAGTLRIAEPFLAHGRDVLAVPDGWPFQLLLYGVFSAGGHAGASVFVAACAAATFAVLWRAVPADLSPQGKAIAWAFLLLVAFACRHRFVPRTEVLAYVLAALGLLLAARWRVGPSLGVLASLGGILALWSQIHLSWVAGAVLVAAPILFRPRVDFWRVCWGDARLRPLILVMTAGAGYGAFRALGIAASILGAMGQGGALSHVTEMQVLWAVPELAVPFSFVAALALVCCWGERAGRLGRLALWALIVAIGSLAARNYAFALLALVVPALEGLPPLARRIAGPAPRWVFGLPVVGAAGLIFLALGDADPPWGAGVRWELFPRDAAAFVKEKHLPEPVLNSFDIGGYLAWAWGGSPATYIDGRVFGENPFLRDLTDVQNLRDAEAILARLGTRTVVVRALYYNSGRLLPLVAWLLERPEWALVRATDALVFVRAPLPSGVAALPAERAWHYVLWEADVKAAEGANAPHLEYSRGIAWFRLARHDQARAAFGRGLARHPEWADHYSPYLISYGHL
jgi:hypothetical protein